MKLESVLPVQTCCPIVELRQYTLRPGQRDVLIELFDREFVDTQEDTGMKVIGQFRDLNDPNRFVWVRGFSDMDSRKRALTDFYGGPIWKAYREAANATMIDSDNVLLLRPASPPAGFSVAENTRPKSGADEVRKQVVVTTVYYFDAPVPTGFTEFFEKQMKPEVTAAGGKILAYLVSENSENTFPALPVRENENVFVWFARFNDAAAYDRYLAELNQSGPWQNIHADLTRRIKGDPEVMRLSPTARSLL
jgi:quinol monooxygenase YgiN